MGDRLDLLHAAPVHHVPVRSREARTSYTPMVTPVHLRELTLGETDPGPTLPVSGGHDLLTRLVDGELWRPIGSNGPGLKAEAEGAAFRDWLEGRESQRKLDESGVARCLESTPVLARAPGQRTPPRPYGMFDVARQGRIVADTRPIAAEAAAAFVATDLALLSGRPYMRMPGPLAYYERGLNRIILARHPGSWTTNPWAGRARMVRADRVEDLVRFERIHVGRNESAPISWDPAILAGLAPSGRDEVDFFAQEAVRLFVSPLVNWPARRGRPYPGEREERVVHYACLAAIGAIPREDLAGLCDLFAELAADLRAACGHGYLTEESASYARYAREVALPRLAAEPAAIAAADAGSLAGLAP